MNATLQRSFDAVESSLATLIASIATHDPSPAAALALIAADDDLSSSLSQLVTHQTNHQQVLHLRALSTALDTELTALLTTLSTSRASLTTNPSPPPAGAKISHDGLLAYATKISKFTRRAPPKVIPGENALQPTEEDVRWIEPVPEMPFTPWPTESDMQKGALRGLTDKKVNVEIDHEPVASHPVAIDAQQHTQTQTQAQTQIQLVDRDWEREEARRQVAEKKEDAVYTGMLDLYDPDEEDP